MYVRARVMSTLCSERRVQTNRVHIFFLMAVAWHLILTVGFSKKLFGYSILVYFSVIK